MTEQNQLMQQSNAFTSPRNLYGSAIVTLTNPDTELHKMELTFRNARMGKDEEIIGGDNPLMNDYGINSIIGIVQAAVNQNTVLSNMNKSEIPQIMEFLSDTLARDLMINRIAYGINTVAARDKIFFTSLTTAYITLKRAYEEGDKRFWKGSVQEYRTTVDGGQSKSKGILSSLNPWNRNS